MPDHDTLRAIVEGMENQLDQCSTQTDALRLASFRNRLLAVLAEAEKCELVGRWNEVADLLEEKAETLKLSLEGRNELLRKAELMRMVAAELETWLAVNLPRLREANNRETNAVAEAGNLEAEKSASSAWPLITSEGYVTVVPDPQGRTIASGYARLQFMLREEEEKEKLERIKAEARLEGQRDIISSSQSIQQYLAEARLEEHDDCCIVCQPLAISTYPENRKDQCDRRAELEAQAKPEERG